MHIYGEGLLGVKGTVIGECIVVIVIIGLAFDSSMLFPPGVHVFFICTGVEAIVLAFLAPVVPLPPRERSQVEGPSSRFGRLEVTLHHR